jgi:AcrR family transcriptional regulator
MGQAGNDENEKKRMSSEQRQERLLTVAAEVFLEKGYEATNLDEIISRAGGSRRNIYTQFGGKEGLFKVLVTEIAERALMPMQQQPEHGNTVRESVYRFAEGLLSALFQPSVLDISRLALADGARFPELARVYYAAGPESAVKNLTAMLKTAQERGDISCLDCKTAASQFVGMLRDNVYMEVLLRLRPAPEQEERKKIIESAVEIFINGLQKKIS